MASGTPTPPSSSRLPFRHLKRDSETAQLDPQQFSAKRTQVLAFSFAQAGPERQLTSLKADKGELERKLKEKTAQVDRFEQDRRWLADREASERKEKEEDAARWEQEKSLLAPQQSKTLSEMRALRTMLNATKELNADLEQANAAQDLARNRDDEIQELKDRLIVQTYYGSSNKENNREDETVIQAELVRQTTYLRDLERTNARLTGEVTRLRERNTSIAVLQEEKRALEAKLVTMEGLRARVAELELQLQSNVSSPSKTTFENNTATVHELSSLRLTHAQLLSEHGTLKERLVTANSQLLAAESQTAEANSAFDALEAEKVELEKRLSELEIKLQASEVEISFLQDLVASYVAESQAIHETLGFTSTPSPAHLEGLLIQYKTVKEHKKCHRASRDGEVLETRELRLKETEVALERERERVKESEERVRVLTDEQTAHLAQIDSMEPWNAFKEAKRVAEHAMVEEEERKAREVEEAKAARIAQFDTTMARLDELLKAANKSREREKEKADKEKAIREIDSAQNKIGEMIDMGKVRGMFDPEVLRVSSFSSAAAQATGVPESEIPQASSSLSVAHTSDVFASSPSALHQNAADLPGPPRVLPSNCGVRTGSRKTIERRLRRRRNELKRLNAETGTSSGGGDRESPQRDGA